MKTNTQVVVDAPDRELRRARSALNALIPTSTGAATAITMIYPELAGRLDGIAVRVPLLNASLVDAVFTCHKPDGSRLVKVKTRATRTPVEGDKFYVDDDYGGVGCEGTDTVEVDQKRMHCCGRQWC